MGIGGGLESHNLIHMVSLDGNACSSLSLSEFQIQQTHSVVLSITRLFALGTPGSNCSCCFWFCGPELLRLFFTSFRFLHEEVKPAFFSHHGNCISKRKRSKHAGLDKHRHYIDTVKKADRDVRSWRRSFTYCTLAGKRFGFLPVVVFRSAVPDSNTRLSEREPQNYS